LEGNIGIIGNGAGLVMATMDLVHLFGGSAANFLDIGGGARPEVIKDGLMLVMSKPGVKAVLINILGGITRCDLVAQGVIEALNEIVDKKPVAVRMMGTNEREGMLMLSRAGVGVYSDMETAAREVITLAGG
jgi:succinyl-CoA synthetase beta subunit